MNRTREQLQQEYEAMQEKLRHERHRLARLENRVKHYDKGKRQKRAHRLITKGAAIESIAPSVREMGERDFYVLMEQIFSLPDVRAAVEAATKLETD